MEQEIKSANYLEIYSELREKNNLEDSLYLFAELIKNQPTHSKDVKPEPISDAVEFAEWIRNEKYYFDDKIYKYVAAWNNYSEHSTKELYEQFKSENLKSLLNK